MPLCTIICSPETLSQIENVEILAKRTQKIVSVILKVPKTHVEVTIPNIEFTTIKGSLLRIDAHNLPERREYIDVSDKTITTDDIALAIRKALTGQFPQDNLSVDITLSHFGTAECGNPDHADSILFGPKA